MKLALAPSTGTPPVRSVLTQVVLRESTPQR